MPPHRQASAYDRFVLDGYVAAFSASTTSPSDYEAARQWRTPEDAYLKRKVQDRINQAKSEQ